MIVNDTYKISWNHYNKDNDIELSKEELRNELIKAINSFTRVQATEKINELLVPKEKYSKSFSKCTIDSKYIVDNTMTWVTFSTGIAIVHPNDTFNRKKGILVSFDDAVSNIENRDIRTLLWDAFWKVREPKREHLVLHTERDRHLRLFLEEAAKKKIRGKHVIYTLPQDTEIWFPRND